MRSITNSIILAAAAVASTASAKPIQEKAPLVDHDAIDALRKMSVFLSQQKNFTVRTETETDYVLDNGQKIRLAARGNIRVERPSLLRADVVSDRKEREYFYDGKSFTIFSPKLGFYAKVDAPPTIGELADQLQTQYGLELPLVDLFRWANPSANFSDIKEAHFIGASQVDGVAADQYAFRQQGVDWQIWIEHGDKPVPRKLVITTTDDSARPEHDITMTWSLGVTPQDRSLFTFNPPHDATKIAIAEAGQIRAVADKTTRHAKRSARR